LARVFRTVIGYPTLIAKFLAAPRPDVVFVGYLGQLDVLVLWPFARARRVPVVWDQFISLYNTIVEDRQLVSPRHLLARVIYAWEWLACRAADRVLMDTEAQADYVSERFGFPRNLLESVWVGAEVERFVAEDSPRPAEEPFTVLFYGQFIPLHGVETIVRAALAMKDDGIRFVLIGSGQEDEKTRRLLEQDPAGHITWIPWVEYDDLNDWIGRADVCLGIFGATGKASRVIPNKVFQIVAAGRPLVTQDSPAIRELVGEGEPGVRLVPPADADALVKALREHRAAAATAPRTGLYSGIRPRITPEAIGADLRNILEKVVRRARS
jgi:glycosyltransferase involved in cell wall biosynthesis